jgi:acyl-CoA thioester hydrolase
MNNFCYEKRVYYHDTDSGGVVYYATYLKFLEESRTEYLRSLGIDVGEYIKKGILFPVVHLEIDYKCPARYGDIIKIFTRVEKCGNASLNFVEEIKKDDKLLLKAVTVLACVDTNMKPRRIPDEMREIKY